MVQKKVLDPLFGTLFGGVVRFFARTGQTSAFLKRALFSRRVSVFPIFRKAARKGRVPHCAATLGSILLTIAVKRALVRRPRDT